MPRTLYLHSNDLRLQDNPALNDALSADAMLPAYILDNSAKHPIQGAAAWWLHQSLSSLTDAYEDLGFKLHFFKGEPLSIVSQLIEAENITKIVCARAYAPHEREQQKQIHHWCKENGIEFTRFASTLLAEPEQIQNKQGSYYKVFTPFSKQYIDHVRRQPVGLQNTISAIAIKTNDHTLVELALEPTINWADNFSDWWQPGEQGGAQCLQESIEDKVCEYGDQRDLMGKDGTSQLSAHLRFGELSPAYVWSEVSKALPSEQSYPFLRQLIWRDFNHHLLFHRPEIVDSCFSAKFNGFPWQQNDEALARWQKAKTGYPIVDAAMQQLWQTGWMHNRARMIVASFLTKHLLISWQSGADWFWDTLVDADLANNVGGWQWTAGCGADAAPYFRIFNPITQGQKFDPSGTYTRRWLPELAKLSNKYIHRPWDAPESERRQAGVRLGDNYPKPIVDHSEARNLALDTYKSMSS